MIDDLVQRVQKLNPADRVLLLGPLTDQQRCFVNEYAVDFDRKRAALASGYQRPVNTANRLLRSPAVAEELQHQLKEREEATQLKAEYVRELIHDLLELCPVDYFTPAQDGGWLLEPEKLKLLPQRVKRLIQSAEMRIVRGNLYLAIEIMSKDHALALAARYTLPQKLDVKVSTVPWKDIADAALARADGTQDPLEQKLRLMAEGALSGLGRDGNGP